MKQLTTIEEVERLYEKWGQQFYSEKVSQIAHAVQCAQLAEKQNAPSALVLAALLHDIGHLADLEDSEGTEEHAIDTVHEATGARILAPLFPPSVTAPIALHVAAKRWLCAREDGYFETLSDASVGTLALQGGKFTDAEADRFIAMPHANDAVSLRRWDDYGKDTDRDLVPLSEFRDLLHQHLEKI
jgi:phosphonate degradation associated HDIG domain protein